MTTIQNDTGLLTLINVFQVTPETQQQVVDLLVEATEQTMRHLPGFVSANIHRSHDGTRVVNYAQWRSQADFDAMLQNEQARPHMQQIAGLVEHFDPILCEVVDTIAENS